MKRFMLACILVTGLSVSGQTHAAYHWVSSSGSAAWDSCVGNSDPGVYCSLSTANTNAAAGDTVYLKAGTYSDDGYINPAKSGTSGSPITYQGYGGTVTITGQSYGVYLSADDYIAVREITFDRNSRFLIILNSDHNIIDSCVFTNGTYSSWQGAHIYNNSKYNVISNSTLGVFGRCSTGSDDGVVLEVGTEESNTDTTSFNLIDNCTMYHGGHHVLGMNSRYNTVRNSHFYNNAWCSYSGKNYGNRSVFIVGAIDPAFGIRNLFEGNRVGYSDPPVDQPGDGASVFDLAGNRNIVRYNDIFRASAGGLSFGCGSAYPVAPSYNYVYNNNMYDNGQSDLGEESGVVFNDWGHPGTMQGNVFKNNIIYSNGNPVSAFEFHGSSRSNQTIVNNMEESVDPKYTDASGTDPASTANPKFALLSDSPAINAGGALTTVSAADTGTGTSLILTDASYFQDGTWAPPGTIQADWIAVGTVTNVIQIAAVNYSINTITLVNAIQRKDGDPVWLYKKSDGVRVLYGSAPDAGAHEFVPAVAPEAPKNLRITQ